MDLLNLVIGIVLAVYGAQLLVDGGVAIAQRYNIPTLVIGSTVVAFGTSMPEFTVNMQSAMHGNTDIALGNILGSNLFNICVIFGTVCLIGPLTINENSASKDFPMCLIAALMVGVAGNELYFDKINYHELMPSDGITFLGFFSIFIYYTYQEAVAGATHKRVTHVEHIKEKYEQKGLSPLKAVGYVVLGLLGLVFGGDFIVDGATGVARSYGLPERVIALLIVGPGTSIPELIASIVAALKRKTDMVVGNVLGSNIFNIFFTLGVTAIIRPVPLDLALNFSVIANVIVTLLLVLFTWFARRKTMGRGIGVLLITAYVAYIVHALMI